jgi:fucose 4-O-acetylase-like acetyltransferase
MLAKLNYCTLTTSNLLDSSECHTEKLATVTELLSLSFCSVLSKLVGNYNLFSKLGESSITVCLLHVFCVLFSFTHMYEFCTCYILF